MKALLSLALYALFAGVAQAQTDFPSRPLRQIVPFPPGGGVDIVTRIVTAKWSEVLGEPIVVENRAGAGGSLRGIVGARGEPGALQQAAVRLCARFRPDLPHRQDAERPGIASFGAGADAERVRRPHQGESRQVQLRFARLWHLAGIRLDEGDE